MSKQQKNENSSVKDNTKTTRQVVESALEPSPLAQFGDIQTLQRAMNNPGGISPRVISGLQRSVGNHQVQRMVSSNSAGVQQFSNEFAATIESEQSEENQAATDANQQAAAGQGQGDDDNSPENQTAQRRLDDTGGVALDNDTSRDVDREIGRGQPLPQHTQTKMKDNMGIADPENINVHTDSKADQLSESLGARAFTSGSDIFFKQGEYDPHSSEGQKLLFHEGWHTRQQGGTNSGNTTQPKMIVNPPDDKYEQEADEVAEQAVQTDAEPQMGAPDGANNGNGNNNGHEEEQFAQDPMAALDKTAKAVGAGQQTGVAQTARVHIQRDDDKDDEPSEEEIEAKKKESKDSAKETKDKEKSNAESTGEKKGDDKATGAGDKVEIPKTEAPKQPEEIPGEFPEPELAVDTNEVKFDPDQATEVEPETEGEQLPTWDDLAEDTMASAAVEVDYHQALATSNEDDIDLTGEVDEIAETVEEPSEELDRGDMVLDALKEGALSGLEEGAASLISDQIMQAATSKIPYADGAINLMQLAMDPEKWATQNVLVIGDNAKKIGAAFSKIGDEDTGWGTAAAVLEALMTIVDFIKSIVDLVNIILTIILFVLKAVSIIMTALIALIPVPFCIMCWASALIAPNTWLLSTAIPILDTVNNAISIIGNALIIIKFATTPIIMLFRSLDLLTSDADPEKLKEKQAGLKDHTSAFVKEGVERAGTKAVDVATSAASKKMDKRKGRKAEKELNAMKKGPDESQSDFDTRKSEKQAEFDQAKSAYEKKYGEGAYDKGSLKSEIKDKYTPSVPTDIDFRKKYKTDPVTGKKVRDTDSEAGTFRGEVLNIRQNMKKARAEASEKYGMGPSMAEGRKPDAVKPKARKPGTKSGDPDRRIDQANTKQRAAESKRDQTSSDYDTATQKLDTKRAAREQADDNVTNKKDALDRANQDFQQAKQDAIDAQRSGDTDRMIEANNRFKEARTERNKAQQEMTQATTGRDKAVQEHNQATAEKAEAHTRKTKAEEEATKVQEESDKIRDDAERQKKEIETVKEWRSRAKENLKEELGFDTPGSALFSTGSQGGQRHGPGPTGASSKLYAMFGIDPKSMMFGDSTDQTLDDAEAALDNFEKAETDKDKADFANQASQALSSVTEDDLQSSIDALDDTIATKSAIDSQKESLEAQKARRKKLGDRAESLGIEIKGSMAHWGEEYNIKRLLVLSLAATGLGGYEKADEKDPIFIVNLATGPEESGFDEALSGFYTNPSGEREVTDTEASMEFYFYKGMNLSELSVDPQTVKMKRSGTGEEVEGTPDMANKTVNVDGDKINVTVPYNVPAAATAQTKPLQRSPENVDENALNGAGNRIDLSQSLAGMNRPGGLIQRAPADEEPDEEMPGAEAEEMPEEDIEEEEIAEEEPSEEMDEEVEADMAEAEDMEAAETEEMEEGDIDPISFVKLGYEVQLFEQLPPPPEGVVEQVQAAALGFSAVDDEEYELKIQEVQIGAMQAHTQGQLSEIRGVRTLAGTNQKIIDKQQEDIDTKLEGQSQMNQQAGAKAGGAESNAQKSGETSGFLGKIFGNLLGAFGFGSAFGAGGEADTDSMKKGTQDQAKETQAGSDLTKETDTITNKWTGETNQVKAGAAQAENELQSFDQMKEKEETDAEQGAAELNEAQAVNEEQQAVVSEEKGRLTEEHGSGLDEAGEWAEEHQTIREEIFAMLDEDMEAAAAGEELAVTEM